MYHLKIKYDEMNDRLIYDRKLEVGLGNEEYGLEVAKSLSIGTEFINDAFVVKNELKDIGLYSTKGSSPNIKLFSFTLLNISRNSLISCVNDDFPVNILS